jgi:SulP family sulfate permease
MRLNMHVGPYPLTLREFSGGLGDLGVLIPLEVALIAVNGLNPTSTLLGVGIIYILAGWYFNIPMPVQPLKSLAIIAIAHNSTPSVIGAAALLMAGALALLIATRGIKLLERIITTPVVKGIQIGLGLLLIKSAYQMVFEKTFLFSGQNSYLAVGSFSVPTGVLLGLGSIILLLLLARLRSIPVALIVIGVGVIVGVVAVKSNPVWVIGPTPISFKLPKAGDFSVAFVLLVLPQLPLTITNSIIATSDAAKEYFGEQAKKATPKGIATSIVLGNLWAGLSGGLPNCHGSGGLTAHYRLGARTPLATTFLGAVLIVVALFWGRSIGEICNLLPVATLGALLFYVGVQHIFLGCYVKSIFQLGLALIVALVSLFIGGNLAIGAVVGIVVYWTYKWLSHKYKWHLPIEDSKPLAIRKMVRVLESVFHSGLDSSG